MYSLNLISSIGKKKMEPPSRARKGKKSKRRRSPLTDSGDATTTALPATNIGVFPAVIVNDPTIVPALPKSTANDIWHFFTKAKEGGKTVCNICRYVIQ
jgi:hypothetical protein